MEQTQLTLGKHITSGAEVCCIPGYSTYEQSVHMGINQYVMGVRLRWGWGGIA